MSENASFKRPGACVKKASLSTNVRNEKSTTKLRSYVIDKSPTNQSASFGIQ